MSNKEKATEYRGEKNEIYRLKEERGLKKISKNTKGKKTSIDESSKGLKQLINNDLNFSTSKRRNSAASAASCNKLKLTPKLSEQSRGNTSKKKLCPQNEKKLSETKIHFKLGVKKRDNMIKADKKIVTKLNSHNLSPRTQNAMSYFNSKIEPNKAIKYSSSSIYQKQSSPIKTQKNGLKAQKISADYEPFQVTISNREKRVRFADLQDTSKKNPNESPSMSSILISETEEWVNPKISPASIPVSDFVKEFGLKISSSLLNNRKRKDKYVECIDDKNKIVLAENNFKPNLNLNSIMSQLS